MSSFASLTGALFYLRAMTLWGAVRSRFMRLKQPKYLFGAVVGVAYLYFFFIRHRGGPPRGGMPSGTGIPTVSADTLHVIAGVAALGMLITFAASWLIPRQAALAFSEAEIAFLFPAPVSRRMLIHYRILSSQLRLVFTAIIFTLIFRRGITASHALGWWVILATINLHFTGSSFVTTRLLNRTLTPVRRRNLTLAAVAIVVAALGVWAWSVFTLPAANDFSGASALGHYVTGQLERGPMPWLLAIPRLTLAPYLAADSHAFLLALGPALAVLVAHYFWVLHSEVSFEEASISRAEKRGARTRAVQQGDWRTQGQTLKSQRPPFTLASTGRPELAFLWKNLFATIPLFRPIPLLVLTVFVIGAGSWLGHNPKLIAARNVIMGLSTAMLVGLLLFGPQLARQDLRSDLKNSDILKTYPLRGWQIVLGELLTPVFVLSVVNWLVLLAAVLIAPGIGVEWQTPQMRVAGAIGIAVLVPPLCAIQLLVPNAAAVIFPAWMQTVSNRGEHGLDVMGQRIIFMAGQLLV
ncbi:MAG TPA: putative ABC exporter domain-containing protein, partial [Steroidobacteraceae bacterium]|nr:putative ABC exporter domain-containing protein [Steroidobacteraceae bacterium]